MLKGLRCLYLEDLLIFRVKRVYGSRLMVFSPLNIGRLMLAGQLGESVNRDLL